MTRLGELYYPKGLALETAQRVLEVEKPMACNVAYGCRNACEYCYIRFIEKGQMRLPKTSPEDLVERQLSKGLKPEGVFLSFDTDLFLKENRQEAEVLIGLLGGLNVKVATLSKINVTSHPFWKQRIRSGMTIVSVDEDFRKKFEPNAAAISERIKLLQEVSNYGGYIWISMEPYPPPAVWQQDLRKVLEAISFVDFLIFGKLNYDRRAQTEEARQFYSTAVEQFVDFCRSHKIRHHVKAGTMKFIQH